MAVRTTLLSSTQVQANEGDSISPSTAHPLSGVQILATLDSKWTPSDLFRDVEEHKRFRKSMFCLGFILVDLKGFEPLTSSMPWKRAPNCATGPHRKVIHIIAFRTSRALDRILQ